MTAQQLCAPMALAKDLSLVLRTHVKGIPMTHNWDLKPDLKPLCGTRAYSHIQTHMQTLN